MLLEYILLLINFIEISVPLHILTGDMGSALPLVSVARYYGQSERLNRQTVECQHG